LRNYCKFYRVDELFSFQSTIQDFIHCNMRGEGGRTRAQGHKGGRVLPATKRRKHFEGIKVEEDEVGGTCGTNEREEERV
jgi:hypothetical protein